MYAARYTIKETLRQMFEEKGTRSSIENIKFNVLHSSSYLSKLYSSVLDTSNVGFVALLVSSSESLPASLREQNWFYDH